MPWPDRHGHWSCFSLSRIADVHCTDGPVLTLTGLPHSGAVGLSSRSEFNTTTFSVTTALSRTMQCRRERSKSQTLNIKQGLNLAHDW